MRKFLLMMLLMLTANVMMAKDIRTLVVTTNPQMHCANCETRIKNQLRFEKGVKRIETNVEKQTVQILYDADRTGSEQLIKSLGKIGYKATPVKDAAKASNAENKSK
jgi:copper chaperone CopZ